MMRRLLVIALVAAAGSATAGEWEAALHLGNVFPSYDQTFDFDPGALGPPFPGATVTQLGTFQLDARGGLALGATLAWQGRVLGLEARVDTADVRVDTVGARYEVSALLPPPIGNVSTTVDLGGGDVDLERLRPLSLNLRAQSPGRVGVVASAGVSYLPAFRFEVRQGVSVDLPLLGGGTGLDVTQVGIEAEALPGQDGQGRFGWNAGGGIRYAIGERAVLVAEGRYFRFQRQTLFWGEPESSGPLPRLQADIVRQLAARLEPVIFTPTFFQASVGVGLRF